MDLITHTLTGLVLAELGFTHRLGPTRARVLGIAAALIPDADILLRLTHQNEWYFDHGGPSHSFLFALAATVVLVGAAQLTGTRPFTSVLVLVVLALGSHLLIDALGLWGITPLWPLSGRRLAFDWLFVRDPTMWVILVGAYAARLLGSSPSSAAARAVMLLGLYVGLQGAAHGVARKKAAAWARLEGFDVERVDAFPEAPGGLFWNTVAVNGEEVLQRPVDLAGAPRLAFRMDRGLEEPLVEEFAATAPGRRWGHFARVGVAASVQNVDGYEVWVRDLRFMTRFATNVRGVPFDLRARFDDGGELQGHTWFTPGMLPNRAGPLPMPPPTGPAAGGATASKGG